VTELWYAGVIIELLDIMSKESDRKENSEENYEQDEQQ
jgi:hypothetical protein